MEGVPLLAWLSQRLSEVDMEVRRRAAAEAVGELGAVATPAILGRLSELLGDADARVREAAARAVKGLGAVATPAILGRLSERLGDRNWWVRRAAVEAVGRLMAQRVRIFEVESGKWEARTVDVLAGES
jgi:HEAT repeat protein